MSDCHCATDTIIQWSWTLSKRLLKATLEHFSLQGCECVCVCARVGRTTLATVGHGLTAAVCKFYGFIGLRFNHLYSSVLHSNLLQIIFFLTVWQRCCDLLEFAHSSRMRIDCIAYSGGGGPCLAVVATVRLSTSC